MSNQNNQWRILYPPKTSFKNECRIGFWGKQKQNEGIESSTALQRNVKGNSSTEGSLYQMENLDLHK